MTTGALKAYYVHYGTTRERTDIELVPFARIEQIDEWYQKTWRATELKRTRARRLQGEGW